MPEPMRLACPKDQLPQELVELQRQIDQLPRSLVDRLGPLADKVCYFTRLQGRLIRIAQEAVEQLQLDVKYLLFDLDATRRERDELRQELEDF
jgi:hypothetical protein